MPRENGKTIFNVTFDADIEGNGKKKHYEGMFTVRDPNFADIGSISASVSVMTQGHQIVDPTLGAILQAISSLSICVEDAPEWWEDVLRVEHTPSLLAINSAYMKERAESPFRPAQSEGSGKGSRRNRPAESDRRRGRDTRDDVGDGAREPEEELLDALADEEV